MSALGREIASLPKIELDSHPINSLSATKVRQMLAEGGELPAKLARPEAVALLMESARSA